MPSFSLPQPPQEVVVCLGGPVDGAVIYREQFRDSLTVKIFYAAHWPATGAINETWPANRVVSGNGFGCRSALYRLDGRSERAVFVRC